jgi:hypothetical protein
MERAMGIEPTGKIQKVYQNPMVANVTDPHV